MIAFPGTVESAVTIGLNTLQPMSVAKAIEKIAAMDLPTIGRVSPPTVTASPNDSKLNALGISAQKAASIITIAGGDVLNTRGCCGEGHYQKCPNRSGMRRREKETSHLLTDERQADSSDEPRQRASRRRRQVNVQTDGDDQDRNIGRPTAHVVSRRVRRPRRRDVQAEGHSEADQHQLNHAVDQSARPRQPRRRQLVRREPTECRAE